MSAPAETHPSTAPASTPPRRVPDPRDQISPERFVFLAVTLGGLVGAVSVLVQRIGSQFYADDFLYLQLARAGSLTPSWLAEGNYGHFAPLTRLAYFAVQRTVGLDYTLAALLPAVLTATILLSLTWMFQELLGRRWVALALALLGATSVPLLRTMLWWGAAVHVLGAAAMMTLCVAAFVVHSRRGQERYRVLSVAALVAGLLVQERPMVTIGYLVLIRYLLKVGLPAGRTVGRLVRREALFWLPWLGVQVAYTVYRVFVFPSAPQPGKASESVEFIGQSVVRGYFPTLVGSRIQPYSPLLEPVAVVGLLALVAVSAVLVRHRRGAWRALAFLVAIYLANIGIVAVGRLNVADLAALATDLQYYVDVHIGTLMAFVLGFTVLPPRATRGARRRSGMFLRVAVPVAAGALVVSTGVTWRAIIEGNNQTVAHSYVYGAKGALEEQPAPFALMRTKLPIAVAPSFIDPYTDVPGVFTLDPDIADRVDAAAASKVAVTDSGTVVAVHPHTIVQVPLARPAASAPVGTLDFDHGGACLSGPAGAYIKVELPRTLVGAGLFFAVTYSSPSDVRVLASLRADAEQYNWIPTDLPAGEGVTVVDRLDGSSARALVLSSPAPLSDLCVSGVWIGRLAAELDGECRTLSARGEPGRPSESCAEEWPAAG